MKILAIFLLIVLIIGLIMVGLAMTRRDKRDFDAQYLDENGDHVYYDRSLIEKKDYMRRTKNPNIRKLRNLFR